MSEQTTGQTYPCGKAEMDVIRCPKCLEHFSGCAAKSRGKITPILMDYMEVQNHIAKYDAEGKKRRQGRAKCRSLAKRILKKRLQIVEMQKEMSKLFYYDGLGRAFNHSDRTCDPKNEKIREALRDEP